METSVVLAVLSSARHSSPGPYVLSSCRPHKLHFLLKSLASALQSSTGARRAPLRGICSFLALPAHSTHYRATSIFSRIRGASPNRLPHVKLENHSPSLCSASANRSRPPPVCIGPTLFCLTSDFGSVSLAFAPLLLSKPPPRCLQDHNIYSTHYLARSLIHALHTSTSEIYGSLSSG